METPLYELGVGKSNRLFIKREDLLPQYFGGNKARIANEYLSDMKRKGADCLIGYGNARSNLNRALAFAAVSEGIPYHIISPSDDDGKRVQTFNAELARCCGAIVHYCSKANVSDTVGHVLTELSGKGYSPYYINGNKYGKGNEAVPVGAYAKVYYEIKEQEKRLNTRFDYLFLATGTGMTQAGLLTSQFQEQSDERIVGISIARDSEMAVSVVHNYCNQYCQAHQLKSVPLDNICVEDNYRCGGYGKSCEDENRMIMEMLKQTAIPLDPTYTGKAFWGMDCYLRENNISGCNVLFIHTGGTPLFYDHLSNSETIDTF